VDLPARVEHQRAVDGVPPEQAAAPGRSRDGDVDRRHDLTGSHEPTRHRSRDSSVRR
jgi:hypothetical protein